MFVAFSPTTSCKSISDCDISLISSPCCVNVDNIVPTSPLSAFEISRIVSIKPVPTFVNVVMLSSTYFLVAACEFEVGPWPNVTLPVNIGPFNGAFSSNLSVRLNFEKVPPRLISRTSIFFWNTISCLNVLLLFKLAYFGNSAEKMESTTPDRSDSFNTSASNSCLMLATVVSLRIFNVPIVPVNNVLFASTTPDRSDNFNTSASNSCLMLATVVSLRVFNVPIVPVNNVLFVSTTPDRSVNL